MKRYKILMPNEDGKFVFTKTELEELLELAYKSGQEEALSTSPTITYPPSPIIVPYDNPNPYQNPQIWYKTTPDLNISLGNEPISYTYKSVSPDLNVSLDDKTMFCSGDIK